MGTDSRYKLVEAIKTCRHKLVETIVAKNSDRNYSNIGTDSRYKLVEAIKT